VAEDIIAKSAKTLRKNLTEAEKLLWLNLRAKQFEGLKFRKQAPMGRYVVDFVCHTKKLVIEVDGGQHAVDKARDQQREMWLRAQGYNVLRFWNNEVIDNIEGVLECIRAKVSPMP
jgi:very-short-patch-repair endonuclease